MQLRKGKSLFSISDNTITNCKNGLLIGKKHKEKSALAAIK